MRPSLQTIRSPLRTRKLLWLATACACAVPAAVHGQERGTTVPATQPAAVIDAVTAERLIKRLDAQEAEIKELRARLATQPAPVAAPTTGPSTTELKTQLDQQRQPYGIGNGNIVGGDLRLGRITCAKSSRASV